MILNKCSKCGKEIRNIVKICTNCGIEIKNNLNETNELKIKLNSIDILIIVVLSIFSIINFIYFNYDFIGIIYFITYVGCYWLMFLYFKNKKSLFKMLSNIGLSLSIIMYFISNCIIYYEGSSLIRTPSIYTFYSFVISFAPLILLYLVILQSKSYGNNKM